MSNITLELTPEVFQERINNVYKLLEKSVLHIFQEDYGHDKKAIDAVLNLKENGNLGLTTKILDALKALLETEEGKNILSTYKRLCNILDKGFDETNFQWIDEYAFKTSYEKDLYLTYLGASVRVAVCMLCQDIDNALDHLKRLIKPLNDFLDNVIVNDEDIDQKNNKLSLLKQIDNTFQSICKWEKLL